MSGSHDDAEAVTETEHDNSWSVNLEQPRHAESESLVLDEATDAIDNTTAGNHVNLVTHADHGHPERYLYEMLDERADVAYEYVSQCGCGGHVTRVHVQ